jgi:GNAT superfamily N-acetyltransferase
MTTADPARDRKQFRIIPLPSDGAFAGFRSGEDEVDRQLDNCCEWHQCHRSRVFCAYHAERPDYLYGFYCLGLHAHEARHVPSGLLRRHRDDVRNFVPFIYVSLFAVRAGMRRQKIGTVMLGNMLERCALGIRNIGAYGVALKSVSDDATAFYDHFGFRMRDSGERYPFMVLPAQSILDLVPG